MKLTRKQRQEQFAATITSTLGLILSASLLLILTASASDPTSWNDPSWWQTRGAVASPFVTTNQGVVTTNYVANNSNIVVEGQLKQFTARATDELNARLGSIGGAGPTLTSLTSAWHQDYAVHNYATNTADPYNPIDYSTVNVGQLKYIANLVDGQLYQAGYTNYPAWIVPNSATDGTLATIGQLKEVFDFDLSLAGPSSLSASANTNGTVNLSWTPPSNNPATSYLIEEQNANGSWQVVGTITNAATTSYAVTNLAPGQNPVFQIIAQNGAHFSTPVSTPYDPGLIPPSNLYETQSANAGEIDLTWQNNATDATYNITVFESTDGNNWNSIATLNNSTANPVTSYAVTNLTVGQLYYFGLSVGH